MKETNKRMNDIIFQGLSKQKYKQINYKQFFKITPSPPHSPARDGKTNKIP